MLARGEEEYALFEEMDRERAAKACDRPRLMAHEELPDWVTAEEQQEEEEEEEEEVGGADGCATPPLCMTPPLLLFIW